jgi:hypothetical protein
MWHGREFNSQHPSVVVLMLSTLDVNGINMRFRSFAAMKHSANLTLLIKGT